MDLPDVNILIAAHRPEHPDHSSLKEWLEKQLRGRSVVGMSELVLSSFLRVVTNHRIFSDPTPMSEALAFVDIVLTCRAVVQIRPGARHFDIFHSLCEQPGIRGNLVTDAYFAALAIESGCQWVTRDRDFARFEDLQWYDPMSSRG